jgi:hypothetical protein
MQPSDAAQTLPATHGKQAKSNLAFPPASMEAITLSMLHKIIFMISNDVRRLFLSPDGVTCENRT